MQYVFLDILNISSKMSISINFAKSAVVLAKHFALIVSYEALKLDGYVSPSNGYLRGALHSRLQAILSNNRQSSIVVKFLDSYWLIR